MKILAIDTSSSVCSVAILEDNKLIKELHNYSEKEHSETLMPMIDEMFKATKLSLDDIGLIACSVGPGSFTGIRIGIATVKAFADAKSIPVVGVNSLEALAFCGILEKSTKQVEKLTSQKQKEDGEYVSLIDARNDNVYFAIYKMKKGLFSIYKNPEVMQLSDVITHIDNLKMPIYFCGDIAKNQNNIENDVEKNNSILNKKIDIERIEQLYLSRVSIEKANSEDVDKHEYLTKLPVLAVGVALAGLNRYKNGIYGDSSSLTPMYLRKPQAQRQKEGKSDDIAILEMSYTDLENIKLNYSKFPNIWEYDVLQDDYNDSKYIVIKQNEEIYGFAGFRTIFEEMEVINIVTREDKRNQGFASNMLSYIIRYAHTNEMEKINLEVNENNLTAIKLYKTYGFQTVGKRNGYYKDGGNAILMTYYI